jgi:hypothetical protein
MSYRSSLSFVIIDQYLTELWALGLRIVMKISVFRTFFGLIFQILKWNLVWLFFNNLPAQWPWAPSIGLNFATLHRHWWHLHISEKFFSGTKPVNNQSINPSSQVKRLWFVTLHKRNGSIWLVLPSDWMIDWLFTVLRPDQEFLLTWKRHHYRWRAAKFRPTLGAQGLWAGKDLYRATPAVTRGLGFPGLIRRTAPFSSLLRHTRGCGGSILTRILSGLLPYKIAKLTMCKT